MSASNPQLDVLETVTRRRDLLTTLADGPRDKPELVDQLECSRSTVDRAIRELEWLEFVRREDGEYRLTATGQLALSEHRRSLATFESIGEASPLLGHIPHDAPLSTAMLDGAETTEPPPHAPTEPLQELADLLDRADRVQATAGAERIPALRERLVDRCIDGSLDAELIVTDGLATFVRQEYPEQLTALTEDGGVDCFVVDSLPYELTIIESQRESRVLLFVTRQREITAVIENDSADALAWATDVYRTLRSTASPLAPL